MKLAVIGYGHLGRALVKGLKKNGFPAADIFVSAATEQTLIRARENGLIPCGSPLAAAEKADIVFITLKKNVFEAVASSLAPAVSGRIFVSFMAGITQAQTEALLGAPVIRAMPSIAIADCDGIIGHTACPPELERIFHSLGFAFEIPEEDIEKVTAVSGSGLGFAAYMLDAYARGCERFGFSPELAHRITEITFRNAAANPDYAGLAAAVATKGGSTEAGILSFEKDDVPEAVYRGMLAAYRKMSAKPDPNV